MDQNFLNTSPHIGLGCWCFGGASWNGQSDADSQDALQMSFDSSIRHLDTAAGYGNGKSEEIVGQFIADKRDQVFLSTKGNMWSKNDIVGQLMSSFENSLERLGTEYIDLYYIHWPNSNCDMRPAIEALEVERRRGRIRQIGVSNFSTEQIAICQDAGTIDAYQYGYSLVWRADESEQMAYCREQEIALVTYSSLGQGILTGKFPRTPHFEGDDVRKGTILFEENVWPLVYEAVEKMKDIADSVNRPLSHLALQWTLRQSGVKTSLVGARNAEQARKNAEAMNDPVADEIINQLTKVSDSLIAELPEVKNIFRMNP